MYAVPPQTNSKTANNNPSIIDMANAAYSIAPSAAAQSSQNQRDHVGGGRDDNNRSEAISLDDRLDAARAMLGISPCSVTDDSIGSIIMGSRGNDKSLSQEASSRAATSGNFKEVDDSSTDDSNSRRRPRLNSAGLDALAFLATQEQEVSAASITAAKTTSMTAIPSEGSSNLSDGCHQTSAATETVAVAVGYSSRPLVANAVTSSSDDDSEIMPPPPPRTTARMTRRRSVSNPEGMDKWGLPTTNYDQADKNSKQTMRRLRLVLPASILEEEIAEANAAMIAKEKSTAAAESAPCKKEDSLPLVVEEEEENLNHDQLLRRARSRLLEDLSQSSLSGEKGVLTLPHSLRKYKEVCYLLRR